MTPDHEQAIRTILAGALAAADPGRLMRAALTSEKAVPWRDCRVLAVGKAAPGMLAGFTDVCGAPSDVLMIVPEGVPAPASAVRADHPVPTDRNLAASRRVLEFVKTALGMRANEVVVLLSGGASALLTLPAVGLTTTDVQHLTRALLGSGADIGQINCVRKHVEQLKGGRLAQLLAPVRIRAFVLSDVIDDDPAKIGSGPVSPDPTTFAEAIEIVERFAPDSRNVLDFLRAGASGRAKETPTPGESVFDNVDLHIIGNNRTALQGARAAAERLGISVVQIVWPVSGEAADAGRKLAQIALDWKQKGRAKRKDSGTVCILFGGETTVTLGKEPGKGGRNQETALAAAVEMEGVEGMTIATLATDGVDGPTDAAGAVVTGTTLSDARRANMNPIAALERHESYTLLDSLGALIRTGPTGTNVNDIAVALVG